jgi:membrane protease YdiL (CAAX protease family)
LLLIVPLLVAVPYVVYRASTGAPVTGGSALADKNLLFVSVLGVIPAHILTLVVAWLVVTRVGKYPFWKTLGWQLGDFPLKDILSCVGIAVGLLLLGILITWLYGGKKTDLEEMINSSYQTRFATAFLAAATAPLVEEIIYRGVLYSALQRTMGMIASVVVVSFLFAGVHVLQYKNNLSVILVITLLSLTLTIARAYTGRLLPAFIIHLVFNGIQSVMLVLSPISQQPEQPVTTPAPGLIEFILRHLS